MATAQWNGVVIASSDDIEVVENNMYFPMESLQRQYFEESDHHSHCPWKGKASYYDIVVDDKRNRAAAWYYPEPKKAAASIANRVAFWRGVVLTK